MARMGSSSGSRRVRRQFSEEFRAGAVRLVLDEGKTVGAVARQLDLTPSALSLWVRHTRADQTKGRTGVTTEERAELAQLRKDNRELRMERDILRKYRGLFRQAPGVVFAWIGAEKAEFPISKLCSVLRVSPSGFYAARGRPESAHTETDRRLRVLVRASFDQSRQRYGSPRIHEDLIEQAVRVSRKRVVRVMQEEGLQGTGTETIQIHDDERPRSAGRGEVARPEVRADAPNRRWVGDTTEFVIGTSGKLYLAAILDLYSRFVVGWAVSAVNDRHVTIKALDMALKRRCPSGGLLHHSTRAPHTLARTIKRSVERMSITGSMSRRGNCYDNAVMESFFSSVKSEVADRFDSCGEAKMELFDYVEVFYNQRRRHSTLGQISPAAFERRATQAA